MTIEPASATRGSIVQLTTRPLWRIRLAREAGRYLFWALALTGLAASARFAIAPPRPVTSQPAPAVVASDRAAEGYAVLFARRYLTWSASDPQASARSLATFLGQRLDAAAALAIAPTGEQRVESAEVVQARQLAAGLHVYTVAAQTDTAGLLYLAVPVARTREGALALTGYPAFVGPPASVSAQPTGGLHEVGDAQLATVVTRALRNYLAGAGGELASDLGNGARVSLPGLGLTLESLQRLDWAPDGRAVLAVVQAQDARGTQYTLEYEIDVERAQGRWEISAVQMDPYA